MNDRPPRTSMLNRLDGSVSWTGIPALARAQVRRRSLRWPSVLLLLLAFAGFAIDFGKSEIGWGYAMIMIAVAVSPILPVLGPLKPWGSLERVDELDQLLRARAYIAGLMILATVAMGGLWLIVGVSVLDNWPPEALRWTVVKFAFVLGTIFNASPTCYASWAQPSLDSDD